MAHLPVKRGSKDFVILVRVTGTSFAPMDWALRQSRLMHVIEVYVMTQQNRNEENRNEENRNEQNRNEQNREQNREERNREERNEERNREERNR